MFFLIIEKVSSVTPDTISSLTDFDSVQTDVIHALGNKNNAYNRVCKACGRPNHHDKDCNFLTKLRQCLAYMKMDKSAGPRKASFYRKKGTYTNRRDKIRVLQDDNFIPAVLNPDIFLDIPDSEDEADAIYCQEVQEE